MASINGAASKARVLVFLAAAWLPTVAYAEPTAWSLRIPLLWLIALAAAVLLAMVPLLVGKVVRFPRRKWAFWLIFVALALLLLVLVGPIIVAVGSIFITGRTM
jgi:hypothetical protein